MADKKGLKMRRAPKNKNYYAAGMYRTDKNKKVKLGAYIRNFPEDLKAQEAYENKNYGSAAGHVQNQTTKARKRQWKNANPGKKVPKQIPLV